MKLPWWLRFSMAPFEVLFILGALGIVALTSPVWVPWLCWKAMRRRKETVLVVFDGSGRHEIAVDEAPRTTGYFQGGMADGPRNSSERQPPENHAA